MPGRTRSLACRGRKHKHASHYRYAEHAGTSLRNGFTAYGALSSVSGLFSHRRRLDGVGGECHSANLIPASGDQDHTLLPSARRASSLRSQNVHRIPPQRS